MTISPTQVPKLTYNAVLPADEIEANDADVQLSTHKTLSDVTKRGSTRTRLERTKSSKNQSTIHKTYNTCKNS
ncbi:unnamed protein product [Rhizophagus irregularis]|nr:unnamed protein product [Rhizophagus irregularis]